VAAVCGDPDVLAEAACIGNPGEDARLEDDMNPQRSADVLILGAKGIVRTIRLWRAACRFELLWQPQSWRGGRGQSRKCFSYGWLRPGKVLDE
jgi:hypothetical protein